MWWTDIPAWALFIGAMQFLVFVYQGVQLRRTISAMRDTAIRQLRAYVHIASAQVRYGPHAADRYITIKLRNYGQSPAMNMTAVFGEHIREWPLRSELPAAPADLRIGIEPLPPGRESIQVLPISELSEWEQGELAASRAGVYVWGTIAYTDIYGIARGTDVRLVCEGEGLRTGLMHACEDGNEAT